ncbi:MAG: glycosyltransferase family 4 protein [Clostridium sp.]|uniref:glycosyltransferase family 4 protein n=1 Tax=Clostridium sp. TaxID=1506 RepID=UPI003D6D28A9
MRKIYFNATILNDKPTGLGVYTINILKILDELNVIDTVIFNNKKEEERYSDILKNCKITSIQNEHRKMVPFFRNYLLNKFAKDNIREQDLFYSPTQHGIKIKRVKQIITIHDLIPLYYPRGRIHQYLYYKLMLPKVIKQSSILVTDSHNTKKDLMNKYNIDSSKIEVIYVGFNSPSYVNKDRSVAYIYDKYKLKDYILMVGVNYRYKNLHKVIEIYSKHYEEIGVPLVIAGNCDNKYGKELKKMVENLNMQNNISFLGYLSDIEKDIVYQAASVFIYPSLYEGFGIPPLEAMANGTHVICSNTSSLPEVVDNAALQVDPKNEEEILRAIKKMININEKDSDMYLEMEHENLKRFGWDKTVNSILSIINKKM